MLALILAVGLGPLLLIQTSGQQQELQRHDATMLSRAAAILGVTMLQLPLVSAVHGPRSSVSRLETFFFSVCFFKG